MGISRSETEGNIIDKSSLNESPKEETSIQNLIRVALSPTCIVHRINVGLFTTEDGRKISTGVSKGFSDLFGHRKSDGRAFYIEVKTATGKASSDQQKFLSAMKKSNAITGIARNAEEALEIVKLNIIQQEEK